MHVHGGRVYKDWSQHLFMQSPSIETWTCRSQATKEKNVRAVTVWQCSYILSSLNLHSLHSTMHTGGLGRPLLVSWFCSQYSMLWMPQDTKTTLTGLFLFNVQMDRPFMECKVITTIIMKIGVSFFHAVPLFLGILANAFGQVIRMISINPSTSSAHIIS